MLVKSADLLVRALTKVASYLKFSEFIIGFMVVAVATSLPELFVGITSALAKTPALALGNIIGANILDMTLVIGITALLGRGLKIESITVRTDTIYMFIITLLPLLLMADNEISRADGFLLILVFALYVMNLLRQETRFHDKLDGVTKKEATKHSIYALIFLILLMFSARYTVKYALLITQDLDVPPILVGLIILSLGTTLPELTFETRAVLKKHGSMALGDLLGSVIINSSLVLGVTAIIYPIHANFMLFVTSCVFMIVISFIFMTFIESERYLSWQEGLALLMLYILFVIVEVNIQNLTNISHAGV